MEARAKRTQAGLLQWILQAYSYSWNLTPVHSPNCLIRPQGKSQPTTNARIYPTHTPHTQPHTFARAVSSSVAQPPHRACTCSLQLPILPPPPPPPPPAAPCVPAAVPAPCPIRVPSGAPPSPPVGEGSAPCSSPASVDSSSSCCNLAGTDLQREGERTARAVYKERLLSKGFRPVRALGLWTALAAAASVEAP